MAGQGPKRQLSNTGSGLRLVTKNTAGVVSPFLLEEPQWSADKDIPTCNVCGEKFSFLVRRHHCRRCGQIFCGKHCDVRVPLPRFSFLDPVRVCEPCSITTRKENEFFDKHLPLLQKEAQLEVESTTFPEQTTRRMFCLLSQFHDVLKFSGDAQIYLREVAITRITKLQMLATPAENGANVVSGVTFIYKDDENSEQTVTLKPFGGNKRPTLAWIMAFKNGMKLIFEAKSAAWDS